MGPEAQRNARYCGMICSIIYFALFFPSFYIAMLSPHLFENADVTTRTGIAIVLLSICAPLSIVIGIGMIWYMYFKGSYKGVYFACSLPLASFLVILLLMSAIRIVFL